MDGLRNFIEEDNYKAMDGLRRRTKSIQVTKPQFSDAYPEAVIRKGADELTLRAEEVGSLRTFIDTTHTELEELGATAGGCRLARLVSRHLPRN